MNPFLADAVALPRPDPGKRPWHAARMSLASVHANAARRLARHAGALAVAAGLAFLPAGVANALDVNTATPEQLQTVRGIGGKTAGIIVQERERGGRYTSMQDLSDRVRGIGPKRLESLQAAGLTVTPPAATPPASTSAPPTSRPGRR